MIINPLKILEKYYSKDSKTYYYLVEHGKSVAKKALAAAKKVKHLNPDLKFIKEAALLHDIGVFLTATPEIDCFGDKPYICHGYLGREILEKESLPKHALIAERHIGCGLTKEDIIKQNLPLPHHDIVPITLEEKIITYADRFFSKVDKYLTTERSTENIRQHLQKYDDDRLKRFEEWHKMFG